MTPKFKVGDVIRSSLRSPVEVIEIRDGIAEDFIGKYINHEGMLCYVTRNCKNNFQSVYSCTCVDSDHHLKGSEMFEIYNTSH